MKNMSIVILALGSVLFSPINLGAKLPPWREAVAHLNWKESRDKLPPFCAANAKKKAPFNGPNFRVDMVWGNHLCEAFVQMPICRQYPKVQRNECLNSMTKNYTYWITHAKDPNFGLLPYLHTGLGELYFEIGRDLDAVQEFMIAVSKNPRYLRAYKGLINAQIKIGDIESAQQNLNQAQSIKKLKAFKRSQSKIDELKKKH